MDKRTLAKELAMLAKALMEEGEYETLKVNQAKTNLRDGIEVHYSVNGIDVCVFSKRPEWFSTPGSRLRNKMKNLTSTYWSDGGLEKVFGVRPNRGDFNNIPMDVRSGITYTPRRDDIVRQLNEFSESRDFKIRFV